MYHKGPPKANSRHHSQLTKVYTILQHCHHCLPTKQQHLPATTSLHRYTTTPDTLQTLRQWLIQDVHRNHLALITDQALSATRTGSSMIMLQQWLGKTGSVRFQEADWLLFALLFTRPTSNYSVARNPLLPLHRRQAATLWWKCPLRAWMNTWCTSWWKFVFP